MLAAGLGQRVGSERPKAFLGLRGRPLLLRAAESAAACPEVAAVVVAVPAGLEADAGALLAHMDIPLSVVAGGVDRQGSVRRALAAVPEGVNRVVCHDAARPFATPALFSAVLGALARAEGAVPVLPIPDTVKRVRDGYVAGTIAREDLGVAQTPQAFVAPALRTAHERSADQGRGFTDDSALMEWAGYRIRTVPGEGDNFKITTAEDLARAERVAARRDREASRGG